jgi:hypothetical protein
MKTSQQIEFCFWQIREQFRQLACICSVAETNYQVRTVDLKTLRTARTAATRMRAAEIGRGATVRFGPSMWVKLHLVHSILAMQLTAGIEPTLTDAARCAKDCNLRPIHGCLG